MRVLVTGGSGFVASHCVAALLDDGHDVVFTVRSSQKGRSLVDSFAGIPDKRLSFVIVEDIAVPGAFDDVFDQEPPLDAVLHTASPFRFDIADLKKDMIDPAIMGTEGLLRSVMLKAESVRRVVITSSFAAMSRDGNHPEVYNESHWSGLTMDQALSGHPFTAYKASKQFAEEAAWTFMKRERPQFELTTLTPPVVFGPILCTPDALNSVNTSSQGVLALVRGERRGGLEPSPLVLWVDVRDLALAHVRSLELEAAVGKRIFVVAGLYRNSDIVAALRKNLPALSAGLPEEVEALPKEFPYGFDNASSKEILGIEYRSLEESITDAARAILQLEGGK
jgi:nucleoside-diphosphate-sugar epimerase